MELGSSIEGMMRAQEALETASANITRKLTPGEDGDIMKDIALQKVAKAQFSANMRVAKTQDDMLGEMLDIMA